MPLYGRVLEIVCEYRQRLHGGGEGERRAKGKRGYIYKTRWTSYPVGIPPIT